MAAVRRGGFEARQLRVAALLIIGLLLLIYGVYRVGKIFDVFADRYTLVTLLPSVAGLREGAPVTLAGQQIGQVDEIRFLPVSARAGDNHLRVTLKVAERIQTQVRRDSRIEIRAQGLLGDKYVDIQPGTLGAAVLQEGDTIPAGYSMDMEQFLARASGMLDQANVVVTDLRAITASLARGEGSMGRLLHDEQLYNGMVGATAEMHELLGRINNGDGSLSRMIRDPEMYQRLISTLTRVDSLGANVLHGNGTLSRLINSDSLYRGLVGTANSANTAAGQLSQMLQKLNDPNGSMYKLMTDPRLFDEFLKSVLDLQTLINDVRENPKKYVPPVQVKVF